MPVSNPVKTVSTTSLRCEDRFQVTLQFDAEPELRTKPADFVLVFDRSGSMAGAPLEFAKRAAKQLITTVAKASGDETGSTFANGTQMGLVAFSNEAVVQSEMTANARGVMAGITAQNAGGSTNHEAAFRKAYELLTPSTKARRLIILFTDGATNVGDPGPIVETIKQAGMEIYCIGLLTDTLPLMEWASERKEDHVAATDNMEKLNEVFAQIAAEAVQAGALDVSLEETLNPDFKLIQVNPPSVGQVDLLNDRSFRWTADAVGAAGKETVTLTFEAQHIGQAGRLPVNASVVFRDRAEDVLTFESPEVEVVCEGPVLLPEGCPLPKTFTVESCKDAVRVESNPAVLTGLGRIVQVDTTVKNVCPGKQVAVAILLTEQDAEGMEYPRGTKTILIPPQTGEACQDVKLKCINFVVPEGLDATGEAGTICNPRTFRAKVLANYVDSDFVCCEPKPVLI